MGQGMARVLDSLTAATWYLAAFLIGAVAYLVLAPWLPTVPLPMFLIDLLRHAYAAVGIALPFLLGFGIYLAAVLVRVVVSSVRSARTTFDPTRHLLYIEISAPLIGLLATTLAIRAAMQGFDPSKGMLSTFASVMQHSGEAMLATAIGIAEAYVARTLLCVCGQHAGDKQ